MSRFLAVLRRDLRLSARQGGATFMALGFFVIAVSLFPFAVGPEPGVLARIAPGVLWVAALLAALLTLDRLFQADQEDGSLDLLFLAPLPLELAVLAKVCAHWLTTGLPLVLASPLLAVFLQLPADGYPVLIASLLLGTPIFSLVGAVGAALTVSLRRGGVLLGLLVLPLYIPALIFGIAAIDAGLQGLPVRPHLLLEGALFFGALALSPIAAAAALRLSLE